MWLLKLFTLKDFRYLVLIALLGFGAFLWHQNTRLKQEAERIANNYQNALKFDSLQVAYFKVKKNQEIKELLDENKELNKLVNQSNVKTKRIQKLYFQQQKYVDSVKSAIDVTPIVRYIKEDNPHVIPWRDSTQCLTVEGLLRYGDGGLNVEVTNREFTNETVLIKHKGRRKPVKWLFGLRLGSREINFTPESNCGTNKVTIIERE